MGWARPVVRAVGNPDGRRRGRRGRRFNATTTDFHIYRLDPTTQEWIDTGTKIDTRNQAKVDALWDGGMLYTVSHVWATGTANNPQIRRFSYDAGSKSYGLDAGFPVTISTPSGAGPETTVIAKDSAGKL